MTQTAPPVPPKKAAKKTEYVVFRRLTERAPNSTETWERIGKTDGSYSAAIKQVANNEDGAYMAVPIRSAKVVTLKTETVKKVTLA